MNPPIILVIDDEPDLRESIDDTLRYEGYELLFAENGAVGLEQFKEKSPILVLLDLRMPVMNGLEVLQQLQVRADDPYAIIVLTGHGDEDEVQQCYELGVSAFLKKPFNIFELQGLVKQSIALKQTLIALRQAEKAKSQFLCRMSHELRTPLNAIIGFAQVQQMNMRTDAPESEKQAAELILSAGRHLLRMVSQILDIEELQRQEIDIPLTATPLNQAIEESVSFVKLEAQKNRITIQYAPTPLCVNAHPDRLKQIIINILDNSIKYNHAEGAVTIVVKQVEQEQIEISIEDTGVGIEAKDQENIFEPFTRLAYAERQEIDGAGIGLALTKFLVQQMNGRIGLDSRMGVGTTFWVRLARSDVKPH